MPHNLSFLLSSLVCTPLVILSIICWKNEKEHGQKTAAWREFFLQISLRSPLPQSPSCWELSRYQSQSCANGACVRTPKSDERLSKNLTSNQKNSSYLQHTCSFHVSMASFREIQYLLTGLFPIV